jgi:hypothetical protein
MSGPPTGRPRSTPTATGCADALCAGRARLWSRANVLKYLPVMLCPQAEASVRTRSMILLVYIRMAALLAVSNPIPVWQG